MCRTRTWSWLALAGLMTMGCGDDIAMSETDATGDVIAPVEATILYRDDGSLLGCGPGAEQYWPGGDPGSSCGTDHGCRWQCATYQGSEPSRVRLEHERCYDPDLEEYVTTITPHITTPPDCVE